MGADIENPDGGDYVAAAAEEEDATDAMTRTRHPTDAEFYWSFAFIYCYLLAAILYVEYEAGKTNPALIRYMVRINLCLLVLLCLVFMLIYFALALYYRFVGGPFKKEGAY